MYDPYDYSKWDNFELTEISNSVMTQAGGYYFHLYTNELKCQQPSVEKLELYKNEFLVIGQLQNDSERNLNRDGLIYRIEKYSYIARQLI
jgi:hypothetical protein